MTKPPSGTALAPRPVNPAPPGDTSGAPSRAGWSRVRVYSLAVGLAVTAGVAAWFLLWPFHIPSGVCKHTTMGPIQPVTCLPGERHEWREDHLLRAIAIFCLGLLLTAVTLTWRFVAERPALRKGLSIVGLIPASAGALFFGGLFALVVDANTCNGTPGCIGDGGNPAVLGLLTLFCTTTAVLLAGGLFPRRPTGGTLCTLGILLLTFAHLIAVAAFLGLLIFLKATGSV